MMANINPDTVLDDILFGSIELSKATWLLALQMTDIEQPSLYRLGPTLAAILTREVYYRGFDNRRQVASYIGLTPSPYSSGESERSRGISKTGNTFARYIMIVAAWLWFKHQPASALSLCYAKRTDGSTGRMRRIMLVALARKLAVALWRYIETGLVPAGAMQIKRAAS